MSERNGGPAFPGHDQTESEVDIHEGMSLRDYFAAKAMVSVMARHGRNFDADLVASESYVVADAMLRARGE